MENKFNIGDKVKVYRILNVDRKRKFIGKIFTINSINPVNCINSLGIHYGVKENSDGYVFLQEELKIVERKPFTKADLKDGMIVEYDNGKRNLVIGHCLVGMKSYTPLNDVTEELTYINRVYRNPGFGSLTNILENLDLSKYLVWERQEVEVSKKMTLFEIEEALGYKVEII